MRWRKKNCLNSNHFKFYIFLKDLNFYYRINDWFFKILKLCSLFSHVYKQNDSVFYGYQFIIPLYLLGIINLYYIRNYIRIWFDNNIIL